MTLSVNIYNYTTPLEQNNKQLNRTHKCNYEKIQQVFKSLQAWNDTIFTQINAVIGNEYLASKIHI